MLHSDPETSHTAFTQVSTRLMQAAIIHKSILCVVFGTVAVGECAWIVHCSLQIIS